MPGTLYPISWDFTASMNAASDMQTITVDDGGIQLAYIDSGVPPQAKNDYTTIFAIHGSAFTSRKSVKLAQMSFTNCSFL